MQAPNAVVLALIVCSISLAVPSGSPRVAGGTTSKPGPDPRLQEYPGGIVRVSPSAQTVTPGRPRASSPLTIHVDTLSPAASDGNPGTQALPLKTVGRATQVGAEDNSRGVPITILIHPGVYREAIAIPEGGTGMPFTLQATVPGQAVISGSDVWRDWARTDGRIFTHPWAQTWGLAPVPAGWPAVPEIVRRREMVYINGRLLRQVLDRGSMGAGTFLVDEGRGVLNIWPEDGVDPNTATTEVAVRPILFASSGRANLTVRGLVFQHAATALDGDAMLITNATNLTVEDAVFRWNNWGGFGVYGATTVTARRNVANNNGGRGMAAWKVRGIAYDDNETSYNNWRGAWGQFTNWAMAGIKLLRLHDGAVRRHKALGNHAYGLWLDFDNQKVTIAGGLFCGNLLAGAFVEASQGPIALVGVTACANGQAGVFTTESQNVTLKNSLVYGNGDVQLMVGGSVSRPVDNWETGQPMTLQAKNWTLCGNAIVATSGTQYVLGVPNWEFFLTTLRSTRNTWWNAAKPGAFRFNYTTDLDLAGWQKMSRQDTDSVFADPRLAAQSNYRFTTLLGSPWQKC